MTWWLTMKINYWSDIQDFGKVIHVQEIILDLFLYPSAWKLLQCLSTGQDFDVYPDAFVVAWATSEHLQRYKQQNIEGVQVSGGVRPPLFYQPAKNFSWQIKTSVASTKQAGGLGPSLFHSFHTFITSLVLCPDTAEIGRAIERRDFSPIRIL